MKTQLQNCIPEVGEHTTQEWQKVEKNENLCVYISQNMTGLKRHMKKKHGFLLS